MRTQLDKIPLTFVGRVLILVTLTFVVGGPFAYFYWMVDDLPPGRYPLVLFALPILLVGALFFWVACVVLKSLGIAVFRDHSGDRVSAQQFTISRAVENERTTEECPWCEAIVVPDEHQRCPACKRPM